MDSCLFLCLLVCLLVFLSDWYLNLCDVLSVYLFSCLHICLLVWLCSYLFVFLPISMSVLSICVFQLLCLLVLLYICLYSSLSVTLFYISVCHTARLTPCRSACLLVCLSACLEVYLLFLCSLSMNIFVWLLSIWLSLDFYLILTLDSRNFNDIYKTLRAMLLLLFFLSITASFHGSEILLINHCIIPRIRDVFNQSLHHSTDQRYY